MNEPESPATRLLREIRSGDPDAAARLLPLVYDELHRLACRAFAGQPEGHTLQPTALLNEAWIRMFGDGPRTWSDRTHFLRVAATAMRHVLVDHARAKRRDKRGEGRVVHVEGLDRLAAVFEERRLDVLALDEALSRLARVDEALVRIVDLRFFAGLTVPEVAGVLGVSDTTVERGWRAARAWLRREVPEPDG